MRVGTLRVAVSRDARRTSEVREPNDSKRMLTVEQVTVTVLRSSGGSMHVTLGKLAARVKRMFCVTVSPQTVCRYLIEHLWRLCDNRLFVDDGGASMRLVLLLI